MDMKQHLYRGANIYVLNHGIRLYFNNNQIALTIAV